MSVGHTSQRLDVANVSRGITDGLAKDRPRSGIDQPFYGVGVIRLPETDGDSLAWQHVSEQGVGGAVELRNRDDVGAQSGDVEHRIIERRLPGSDAQGL